MRIAFLVCLIMLGLVAPPAQAAGATGALAIVAVVNGEAITSYDVDARTHFMISTTKLTNSADVIERLRPQMIRTLIDEKLQLKEAAANNITISDDDVARAIAGIEQQRSMKPGSIFKLLASKRVPPETFTSQIRAQLAWNKLLSKKIRPKVKISEEDIALAQKRMAIPAIKQEMEIALLTLPVDKPQREGEVRRLVEKLSREMRAGASFEEVARQFSSASTTAAGKILTFWVKPEQLDPVVAKALATSRAGSITPPLRTPDGYTIVKVYNTRALSRQETSENQVRLKDILLKLKPDADNKEAEALLAIGEEVAKNPGTCEDEGIAGIDNLKEADITVAMKTERLSDLTPAVRTIVQNLKVGEISAPFATDDGIQLYMLCGQAEAPPASQDKERVYAVLFQQKMELEAEKYMRDLRRDAYIEVRG